MTAREAGERLAAELRAVHELLVGLEVDEAALAEAADRVAAARAALVGPAAGTRRSGFGLFHGPLNPLAAPMSIEIDHREDRSELVGSVVLGPLYEGPPGHVHGGYLAGLFDDLLGGAQRLVDGPVALTGRLSVRYRRPTPLSRPLELRAWIDHDRGRRLIVRGRCEVDGERTADAEGLFVRLPAAHRQFVGPEHSSS